MASSYRNLTLENVENWPLPVKLACYVLAFGLTLGVWYKTFVHEHLETLNVLAAKEAKLKQDIEKKWALAANLEVYRRQLTTVERALQDVLRELPSEKELPSLLRNISDIGVNAGLDIVRFEPQKHIDAGFYLRYPIKIAATSDFHGYVMFLDLIADMQRIVNVTSFSLKSVYAGRRNGVTKAVENGQLASDMTLETYQYKDYDQTDQTAE